MRKEEKGQQGRGSYRFTQVGKGILLAFGFTVFFLVLFSFGISRSILREQDMEKIAAAASVLGVFLGALIAGREGGTLHGILVSAFYVLCILAVKLLIYHSYDFSVWSVITILSVLFSGILSGFPSKGKVKRKGRGGKRSRK